MTDRHATMDELLALRDGEGTVWTRDHAAACTACTAELFRLEQMRARLKALPVMSPPRDRWSEIRVRARKDRRSRWVRSAVGIAAAAALTGLTFIALQPKPADASEQVALDRAMARSQALEQTLKAIGPEAQVLNGDAARAVAELEDRLTRIDAQLGQPSVWGQDRGTAADLWQERAGVLGALVDVRTTRAAFAGL
jgi:hypothetical protein